ncbi:hypothetical protein GCM10010195_63110 [Kitasatospora griseola]|nr:hypothetical protein GCM10010195_63110 [Kitasatospora griseola]
MCIASWTIGRAGVISDWSSANTPAPAASTPKVRRWDWRFIEPSRDSGRGARRQRRRGVQWQADARTGGGAEKE